MDGRLTKLQQRYIAEDTSTLASFIAVEDENDMEKIIMERVGSKRNMTKENGTNSSEPASKKKNQAGTNKLQPAKKGITNIIWTG